MSFLVVKLPQQTATSLSSQSCLKDQLFEIKTHSFPSFKPHSFKQYKCFIIQSIQFLFDLICVALTIIIVQVNIDWDFLYEKQLLMNFLTIFSILSGLISIGGGFAKHQLRVSINQSYGYTYKWSELTYIIGIGIFSMIHISQFTENIPIYKGIQLNDFLSAVTYLKIIFLIFYIVTLSKYAGLRADRMLKLYGAKFTPKSYHFPIKCLFTQQAFKSNSIFMIATILISSLILMKFTTESTTYMERVYFTIITMTTVGYGQVLPQNEIQKFICTVIVIFGSIASSLYTLSFLNNFELDERQSKAFEILSRLQTKLQINEQRLKIVKKHLNNDRQDARNNFRTISDKTNKYLNTMSSYGSSLTDFYHFNYMFFRNKLKILMEKQLLIDNLLKFFLERLNTTRHNQKKQLKSKRRVEDNGNLYELKIKIIDG